MFYPHCICDCARIVAYVAPLFFTVQKDSSKLHGKKASKDSLHTDKPSAGSHPCPHCGSTFQAPSNLRRHQKELHNLETMPMMCIDHRNGIYVTPRYSYGPLFPIHVIKSTTTPVIGCEVQECQQLMKIAGTSGNPGKECVHLERTQHAAPYSPAASLTLLSLQQMQDKGLISKEWSKKCEELHNSAVKNGVDTVYPIFYGDMGYSDRWVFFSVYTDKKDNWCPFGRTRVSFDALSGRWNCQCRGTGQSHRCLHRMLAMCWIFQESPHLLLTNTDVLTNDIKDLETDPHVRGRAMSIH